LALCQSFEAQEIEAHEIEAQEIQSAPSHPFAHRLPVRNLGALQTIFVLESPTLRAFFQYPQDGISEVASWRDCYPHVFPPINLHFRDCVELCTQIAR
jgi:hypothetical protein